MAYNVVLTEFASDQLDDIVEYVAVTLCNPAAAINNYYGVLYGVK